LRREARNIQKLGAALLVLGLLVPATRAEEVPYNTKLIRLAEILGSVHYLRNLCGEISTDWRDRMSDLVASENPPPERKAAMIASFNHGYRSFDSVHLRCTTAAITALDRFMTEGETLSEEIALRYEN
jgi:uncharacterized protein (TIGR02301 family)